MSIDKTKVMDITQKFIEDSTGKNLTHQEITLLYKYARFINGEITALEPALNPHNLSSTERELYDSLID